MKKALWLAIALLLAGPRLALAGGVGVDGAWFESPCFGCPTDKVKDQVLAAQDEMDLAEKALTDDRSDENLSAAIDASLFSYVKAAHALELGDNAKAAGNNDSAIQWYQTCIKYADAAIAMPSNALFISGKYKDNVPERSHAEGRKWRGYAQRHLAELGH